MSFLKKVLVSFLILFTNFSILFANLGDDTIKNELLGTEADKVMLGVTISGDMDGDLTVVDDLFLFVKNSISDLLLVIVVGVFLFMGMRLVMARGNPEELKKTMMQFIYVVIGIFIVSIAWAIVKLISGLNI